MHKQKIKKVCWVCENSVDARARLKQFGNGDHTYFTYLGGALVGRRFDEIFIDCILLPDPKVVSWVNCSLITCLAPGGLIHAIKPVYYTDAMLSEGPVHS